jgi:outer membrane lipoprotein carrier protein
MVVLPCFTLQPIASRGNLLNFPLHILQNQEIVMVKRLLISLLLLAIPAFVYAAEIELRDIVTALETPFKYQTPAKKKITDFQADFLQQSHIASIGRTQHGKGVVSFKFTSGTDHSLAKFRWEYQKPAIQDIISDGKTMWVYIPDNRQVIESDISQLNTRQGENPVTFLSNLGNLSRNFSIAWNQPRLSDSGDYQLLLVPLKPSQFIEKIEITVSKKAVNSYLNQHRTGKIFPIMATLVTDPSGNRTAITFKNIKINQHLDDKRFTFIRPPGVELVDPGQQMGF